MKSLFKTLLKLFFVTAVLAVTSCSDYEFVDEEQSSVGGDDLGNHTATTDVNLNGNQIVGEEGSEGIFVSPSGDVGVGTLTPEVKFEVNGQIKISGGNPGIGKILQSDENGVAIWVDPAAGTDTTATAVLTSPVDPLGPSEGDVYYNTTDQTLYVYDGSSWLASNDGGNALTAQTALQVLASGVQAGTFGPGVLLPSSQISGAIDPSTQIGSGALGSGVTVSSTQITGSFDPTTQLNGSVCGVGQILIGNGTNFVCVDPSSIPGQANSVVLSATNPPGTVEGQVYYNTTDNTLYSFNGTIWVPTNDGGAAASVAAAGVQPGTLSGGVLLPASQISGSLNPLTQLNGGVCTNGQILQSNGTSFTCIDGSGLADNLGDHTASQNIDLSTFRLVGNGGTEGLLISNAGVAEFENQIKINGGAPGLGKVLVSDATGLASWEDISAVPGANVAESIATSAVDPVGGLIGDVYYNTSDNRVYTYDGALWTPVNDGGTADSVAADDVTAGTLGAGVVLPTTQLTGTINPATQIGAGALGSGVTVASTQITGSLDPTSQLNGSVCASGQILISDGTNFNCINPNSTPGAGEASSVTVSGVEPTGTAAGEVYYNTTDNTLYTFDGTTWNASNDGGDALTVPATGVQAGVLQAGVILPAAQIDGSLNPLTQLNGGVCTNGQILQSNGTSFTCVDGSGLADNLGNHTASQNIDLSTFKLVGNGGTEGLLISNAGVAEFENQIKINGGAPGLGKVLVSDATGLASWEDISAVSGANVAESIATSATEPAGTAEGEVYYNTTDNTLYTFDGATWNASNDNGDAATVPASGVQAGNLSAGVTLPSTQITGTINPNTQIGAGTLNSSVSVASTQITGSLNPLTQLNGGVCTNGQILQSNGTSFTCIDGSGLADNLGNHTASQNIDISTFRLVGNGGTEGLLISNAGVAEFENQIKINGGAPGVGKVLVSDATGLASWEDISNVPGSSIAESLQTSPTDPIGASEGDVYFNTTDNTIYSYDGTTWNASNDGGTAGSVAAASVTAGTLPTGVILPAAQLSGLIDPLAQLDGGACANGEILQSDGTNFSCVPGSGLADNLGNHTASQNIDISTFRLVGNGGTEGLLISNAGVAEFENQIKINGGAPGLGKVLVSDATGLASWEDISAVPGATEATSIQTAAIDPVGGLVGDVYYNTSDNRVYTYDGALWTPVNDGGTAAAVPATGVTAGTLPTGVLLPTTQLSGSINPLTQLDGGICASGEILQSDGTNFSCVPGSGLADNLGNHTAAQAVNLNGNYLSGDGDAEGVFVDTAGNVGIGTTSPGEKLHVDSGKFLVTNPDTSPNGSSIDLGSPQANIGITYQLGDGAGTRLNNWVTAVDKSDESFYIQERGSSGTTGPKHLVVSSGGNVGIGVTDPDAKLEVNGQVKITGGVPGANKVLTSDADGLASWRAISSIPGSNVASSIVTSAADPVGVAEGEVYFNTTDNTIYSYDGTSWNPSNEGGVADSVPATGVTAGTLPAGVILPTTQLSGSINPLTQLNGGACASGEVLQSDGVNFSCITVAGLGAGDNLGNHTASQNIDISTFKLVGNGGTEGLLISNAGVAEFENQIKINGGAPGLGKVLVSDATGLASWENISGVPGANIAESVVTAAADPIGASEGDVYYNTTDDTFYTHDGTDWSSISDGGDAATVPASGVQAGTFNAGVLLPAAQINGAINPITQLDGGICANGEILQSNGTNFSCVPGSGLADNLGNHTATQAINLDGNYLSGDGDAEGVFVSTDGEVGVGIALPEEALDVDGNIRLRGILKDHSGQNVILPNGRHIANVGNASSPSYTFQSSGSTGFFKPTSDEIGFSTGGVEAARFDSLGNFGIGVIDPDAKLEVAGQVKITGGSPGVGKILVSDADGLATWQNPGAATGDNLGNHTATQAINLDGNYLSGDGDAEGVFVDTAGNVGLGTVSPSSNLEIQGVGGSLNGLVKLQDSIDADEVVLDPSFGLSHNRSLAYMNNAVVGGSLNFRVSNAAARDTTALSITSNGNVGIGVTDPDAKLEVAGQVKITGGSPGADKILTSDADGLATWRSISSIPGSTIAESVQTSATDPVGALVGDVYYNTLDNTLYAFDGLLWNAVNDGGTADAVAAANVTAGTFGGGVLLPASQLTGTMSPLTRLDGSVCANGEVLQSDGTNFSCVTVSSLGAGDDLGDHTATQAINLDGNYLSGDGDAEGVFVDTAGNVGAGTTSPESKVHIFSGSAGAVTSNTGAGLTIEDNLNASIGFLSPNTGRSNLFFGDEDNNNIGSLIYDHNDDSLRIRTSGSQRVTVSALGNVGIGTVSPESRLTVLSGTPGFPAVSGSTDTAQVSTFFGGGQSLGFGVSPTGAWLQSRLADDYSENRVLALNPNGGRVGVGTSSPDQLLHLSSADTSGPSIDMESLDVGGRKWRLTSGATANSVGAGKFAITDVSAFQTRFAIDTTGNIGIGVTDPDAKLEVAGQVKITGGAPGVGKVLVSDADGLATWQNPGAATGDNLGNHTATQAINLDGNYLSGDGDAEGVFVDTAGNVGVGTVTPYAKTSIIGGADSALHIGDADNAGGMYFISPESNEGAIGFGVSMTQAAAVIDSYTARNTSAAVIRSDNGAIAFTADEGLTSGAVYTPTTRMRISSVGDVGIGIGGADPDAKLEVAGQVKITGGAPGANKVLTSDADGLATWEDVSSLPGVGDDLGDHTATQAVNLNGNYLSGDGDAEGVFVDTAGNVGIGTAAPIWELEVKQDIGPSVISVQASQNSGAAAHFIGLKDRVAGYPLSGDNLVHLQGRDGVDRNYVGGIAMAAAEDFTATEKGTEINFATVENGTATASNRMTIANDGNVGIGTVTPSELVEINGGNLLVHNSSGNSINISTSVGNGNDSTLRFQKSRGGSGVATAVNSGDNLGTIQWQGYDGSSYVDAARINVTATNVSPGVIESQMAFITSDSNIRMLIGENGNIGMGTVSPTTRLDVDGQIRIRGGAPGANKVLTSDADGLATWEDVSSLPGVGDDLGDHTATQAVNLNGNYLSGDGDAEGVFVDAAGSVGVGTVSPTVQLEVAGSSNKRALFNSSDALSVIALRDDTTSASAVSTELALGRIGDDLRFYTGENASVKMYIAPLTGNVGIGTTSPLDQLDISGSASGYARLNGSNATLSLKDNNATNEWRLNSAGNGGADSNLHIEDAGDIRMSFDPAGNVGIGVVDPDARLEVNGQVKITGGAPGANKVLTSDADGLATWEDVSSLPGVGDDLGNHTATTNINLDGNYLSGDGDAEGVFVDAAGNVGVGTTSLNQKLGVAGAIELSGLGGSSVPTIFRGTSTILHAQHPETVNNHVTQIINARAAGGQRGFSVEYYDDSTPAVREFTPFYINNIGNVGIGVTDPDAKLEVDGQVKITGGAPGANKVLTSDADGLATWEDVSSLPGVGDDLGDHTATTNINLDGNYLSGDGDAEGVFVDTAGNVGVGTTTPTGGLEVSRDGSAHALITGYGNAGNERGLLTLRRSRGTQSSPSATLDDDLLGSLQFNGHDGSSFTAFKSRIDARATEDYTATAQGSDLRFMTTNNGATDATVKMTVDNSGNVGIGNQEPNDRLDVDGAIRVSGATTGISSQGALTLSRFNGSGSHPNVELASVNNISAVSHNRSSGGNGGLAFDNYSAGVWQNTSMYLDRTGEVGIGTTNPTESLDVNGQIRIRGGSPAAGRILSSDANGVGTWVNPSTVGGDDLGDHTATENIQLNGEWLSHDGDDEGVFVDAAGNVGIGTATPGGALEVVQNGAANALRLSRTGLDRVGFTISNNGSNDIFAIVDVDNGGFSRLSVEQGTGNVGIGTTNPTESLDVNGQIRIRGGSPAAGRVLSSDVNGVGTWVDLSTVGGDDLGDHTATENIQLNGEWLSHDGDDEGVFVDTTGNVRVLSDKKLFIGENNFTSLEYITTGTELNMSSISDVVIDLDANANDSSSSFTIRNDKVTNLFTVLDSGEVGIGTTTPSSRLEIFGESVLNGSTNKAKALELSSSDGNVAGWIGTTEEAADSNKLYYYSQRGNGGHVFATNASRDGAFVIQDNGSVGIGTISPSSLFEIQDTNAVLTVDGRNESSSSRTGRVQIQGARRTAGNTFGALDFTNYDSDAAVPSDRVSASIEARTVTSTTDSSALLFYTSDAGTLQENMRIEENGNVGIGTGAPSSKLEISDVGGATFTITADTDNVGEADNPKISLVQDGGGIDGAFGLNGSAGDLFTDALVNATYVSSDTIGGSSALQFVTDSNARMTVLGSGNVGIGTTAPSSALEVEAPDVTGTSGVVYGSRFMIEVNPTAAAGGSTYASQSYSSKVGAESKTNVFGAYNFADNLGTGTVASLEGARDFARNDGGATITTARGVFGQIINSADGTINTAQGVSGRVHNTSAAATVTNAYGGFFDVDQTAGTITNAYGVFISNSSGVNEFGLYQAGVDDTNYFAGDVGIGTTSPEVELDVHTGVINAAEICDENNTNCINLSEGVSRVASGATNPGSATQGDVFYNTNDDIIYVYNGSDWESTAASGSSDAILTDSDPSSISGASVGDIAYDTTDDELQVYDGSAWVNVADSSGDDLGDHVATQNIELNGNWISNDGGNEGIRIDDAGRIGFRGTASTTARLRVNSLNTEDGMFLIGNANGGFDDINMELQGAIGAGASLNFNIDTDDDSTDAAIRFSKNAKGSLGTRLMTILENGNVGIGTESPTSMLEVVGSNAELIINGRDGAISGRSGVLSLFGSRNADGNKFGSLDFYNYDNDGAQADEKLVEIAAISDGDDDSGLTFSTALDSVLSEAMRIDRDGNIAVGRTNASARLHIDQSSDDTTGGLVLTNTAGTTSGAFFTNLNGEIEIRGLSAGNPTGLVVETVTGNVGIGVNSPGYQLEISGSAGKPGGGSWSNSSDRRLKDIHGKYEKGLEEILELNPVVFNYKKGNERNLASEPVYRGFIAQEVDKVFDEAVNKGSDGFLDFNMHSINVAMVNAVKSLYEMIVEAFETAKTALSKSLQNEEKLLTIEKENEEIKEVNEQLKKENEALKKRLDRIEELLLK